MLIALVESGCELVNVTTESVVEVIGTDGELEKSRERKRRHR